ncbi:MAG: galactose-1-phosphate uridylyltransferase [bacterium]|nr:galactose-1-phosphate uridylyltransferase [bacterium]
MSELRRDPITKRWVIMAPGRTNRPHHFKKETKSANAAASCPFCPGNEDKTPPEIRPVRNPANCSGWQIRVVPNKFNAVGIDSPLKTQPLGICLTMTGYGAHEVIIESPNHDVLFEDQPIEHLMLILSTFKERLIDLYKNQAMKQVIIFKNHGAEAGASITHPHSQVIALPIAPIHQKEELKGAKEYYGKERSCIWCDIIRQELFMNIEIFDEAGNKIKADPPKERLVWENQSFLALCPFASRFPYEIHLLPKRHSHYFGNMGDGENSHEIKDLAEIFKITIKKLNAALKDIYPDSVPFNFVLHTSPNLNFKENSDKFKTIKSDFHWHFELYPVLSAMAGFEKGSGFYINVVPPEEAARKLREAAIE